MATKIKTFKNINIQRKNKNYLPKFKNATIEIISNIKEGLKIVCNLEI